MNKKHVQKRNNDFKELPESPQQFLLGERRRAGLSVRDIAGVLGVSRSLVYDLINSPRWRRQKVGRVIAYLQCCQTPLRTIVAAVMKYSSRQPKEIVDAVANVLNMLFISTGETQLVIAQRAGLSYKLLSMMRRGTCRLSLTAVSSVLSVCGADRQVWAYVGALVRQPVPGLKGGPQGTVQVADKLDWSVQGRAVAIDSDIIDNFLTQTETPVFDVSHYLDNVSSPGTSLSQEWDPEEIDQDDEHLAGRDIVFILDRQLSDEFFSKQEFDSLLERENLSHEVQKAIQGKYASNINRLFLKGTIFYVNYELLEIPVSCTPVDIRQRQALAHRIGKVASTSCAVVRFFRPSGRSLNDSLRIRLDRNNVAVGVTPARTDDYARTELIEKKYIPRLVLRTMEREGLSLDPLGGSGEAQELLLRAQRRYAHLASDSSRKFQPRGKGRNL